MAKKLFKKSIIFMISVLLIIAILTIYLDPFFCYHKPLSNYYYRLYDQRMQNNGIINKFDYDAVITGTSMTENFKASMADELFDVNSIKVCFSGATYKELSDNIENAISNTPDLKMVICSLDLSMLDRDKDEMRYDMGEYPTYLYNANPIDDVKYFFNGDVLTRYIAPMLFKRIKGEAGGHTSFDDYSSTYYDYEFGTEYVLSTIELGDAPENENSLSDEQIKRIRENLRQNVYEVAANNPGISFYYFIPPYSMAYWGDVLHAGDYPLYLQMQEIIFEELLSCDNIKLYSYDLDIDITSDLDNYRDAGHYGYWINDLIMENMANDVGLITSDNYSDYLLEHERLHREFDYMSLLE